MTAILSPYIMTLNRRLSLHAMSSPYDLTLILKTSYYIVTEHL